MLSTLLLVALLAADVPPTAGSAPAAPPPAAAPAKPATDELICHSEKELGSNLSHRVCRHQSEIDARAQQDRDNLEQLQNGSHGAQGH